MAAATLLAGSLAPTGGHGRAGWAAAMSITVLGGVWHGLDVFRSDDLEAWQRQGLILDTPGEHPDDRDYGRHADVVVVGPDLAYIFYFTHPGEASGALEGSHERRRSAVHAAALTVEGGRLVCHRDREILGPFLVGA